MTSDIADLVARAQAWLGAQPDDAGRTMHASHPEVIVTELLAALEAIGRERDEARATNRELHRRVQSQESEEAQNLRLIKYYEGNRLQKMWSDMWKSEFDRVCSAHQEFKLVYEIAAKALGLPFSKYHSVMDSRFGKKSPDDRPREVFANVFIHYPSGGCEAFSVVRSVQALADKLIAAEAALSLQQEGASK